MKSFSQRKSQRQEKYAAKDIGGRVQPGSGSQDFAKGDVRSLGRLLVECKTTSKHVYSLKLIELQKIIMEAMKSNGEGWAFQVEFQGQAGMSKKITILDAPTFQEMGGVLPNEPLMKTDKKSVSISVSMASYRPWLIHWHAIGPKGSRHFLFAVCPWADFVDLYDRKYELG